MVQVRHLGDNELIRGCPSGVLDISLDALTIPGFLSYARGGKVVHKLGFFGHITDSSIL